MSTILIIVVVILLFAAPVTMNIGAGSFKKEI
jgi:hypothetical protein